MRSFIVTFDGHPLVVIQIENGIIECILDRYAELYGMDRTRINGMWCSAITQDEWNEEINKVYLEQVRAKGL
tara:strand:- start:283 stop:498 length:216 start_codon:yes stop_codon:yes gene_type:complete